MPQSPADNNTVTGAAVIHNGNANILMVDGRVVAHSKGAPAAKAGQNSVSDGICQWGNIPCYLL